MGHYGIEIKISECEPMSQILEANKNDQLQLDDHPIVYIEFEDGRPFVIVTEVGKSGHPYFDFYDIDYSKTYGYYCCHLSGMSPSIHWSGNSYWIADGFANQLQPVWEGQGVDTSKRIPLPPGIQETINGARMEVSTIYCSTCDDHMPNESWNLCEHIWWCEKCELDSTPDERCGHRRPRN